VEEEPKKKKKKRKNKKKKNDQDDSEFSCSDLVQNESINLDGNIQSM